MWKKILKILVLHFKRTTIINDSYFNDDKQVFKRGNVFITRKEFQNFSETWGRLYFWAMPSEITSLWSSNLLNFNRIENQLFFFCWHWESTQFIMTQWMKYRVGSEKMANFPNRFLVTNIWISVGKIASFWYFQRTLCSSTAYISWIRYNWHVLKIGSHFKVGMKK